MKYLIKYNCDFHYKQDGIPRTVAVSCPSSVVMNKNVIGDE